MNRVEKQQVIQELNDVFRSNRSVLLLDFSGVNVGDETELRRKVRESGSHYRVVKNTLAKRAAADTVVAQLDAHLQGPTAIAYTSNDPVALAKLLSDFVKAHPGMSFKGGLLDESFISAEEAILLAEMPSREELLSKLLFLLNASLTQLASALQSPLVKLGIALKEIEKTKSQG